MLVTEIFLFGGLLLFTYLCTQYIAYRKRIAFAAKYGCKPAPAIKQAKWLNGVDLALRVMRLRREKTFLKRSSLQFQSVARTFTIKFLGGTRIWTIEPENIKTILQSDDFENGWIRNKAFRPYLGNGVQATNGEVWAHGRALLRPSFTRAQISNLGLYEEHFQNFVSLVPEDGSTIDIQREFHRLSMDVSTEILFGESVHCLQTDVSQETQALEAAFDYATKGIITRFSMGNLIWLHWDPKFTRSVRTLQAYVQKFVDRAIALRHEQLQQNSTHKKEHNQAAENDPDDTAGPRRYVFLEALARDTGDPLMLRDQLLSMMAAGRSNTASLLSLVFYLLARHPAALARLRDEISSLHGQSPTFEQLRSMPYLKAVLDETLRIYPSAPLNERAAKRDTLLPLGGGPDGRDPVLVRQGETVFVHVYALHRSTELWGDDAAEFRPERWEGLRGGAGRLGGGVVGGNESANGGGERKGAKMGGTAWRFIPFGGGARVCPGQTLALTETAYFMVRLLQTFSVLENRDEEPFEEGLGVVFNSARGVRVGLMR